ncbi:hypothetical protein CSKR_114000 [Clonorchis sinensis]|uniref:Uncharacterized protein n=2 Tax=Clonorchis sinensis TaxID=79923 RepID=A0A8T1M0E4_CLOSI|nr:hypothetical protein CSKR_114000 [Clonorchis sinensis]GAA47806.1 hypothetical protein CLF_100824 [Clonorchis sinensis]
MYWDTSCNGEGDGSLQSGLDKPRDKALNLSNCLKLVVNFEVSQVVAAIANKKPVHRETVNSEYRGIYPNDSNSLLDISETNLFYGRSVPLKTLMQEVEECRSKLLAFGGVIINQATINSRGD